MPRKHGVGGALLRLIAMDAEQRTSQSAIVEVQFWIFHHPLVIVAVVGAQQKDDVKVIDERWRCVRLNFAIRTVQ